MNRISTFLSLILSLLLVTSLYSQTPDDRGYIVKVGDKVENIEFELIDGTKTSLHELKGQVVMLQFTASWCSVCRKEMPFIEDEIWQVYKDQGLMVIGVDRDEPLETVLQFQEKIGTTYPLSLDIGAEIFRKFASAKSGVTRNVLINKEGEIVFLTRLFEREEFDELKMEIRKLLEE